MKITINEQPQMFHLSTINRKTNKLEWVEAAGHGFNVGKYQLCATPAHSRFIVSEVTTGSRLIAYPITWPMILNTATKDEFLEYLQEIGESVARLISKTKNIDSQLEKMREKVYSEIGEPPKSYDIDALEEVQ